MGFSPRQIAAHWVPGFTLLAMIFLIDLQNGCALIQFVQDLHWNAGVITLALAAAGFVLGNFLDALRDLFEECLDRFPNCDIEWKSLIESSEDKIRRLEDYYFTPYVLSANLTIGLLITFIADLVVQNHFPRWGWCVVVVAAVIFGQDAWRLRSCVVKISHQLWDEVQGRPKNETTPSS